MVLPENNAMSSAGETPGPKNPLSARAEVIFDATKAEPRVLFLRDMSHLGRGYALETLGVEFSEEIVP